MLILSLCLCLSLSLSLSYFPGFFPFALRGDQEDYCRGRWGAANRAYDPGNISFQLQCPFVTLNDLRSVMVMSSTHGLSCTVYHSASVSVIVHYRDHSAFPLTWCWCLTRVLFHLPVQVMFQLGVNSAEKGTRNVSEWLTELMLTPCGGTFGWFWIRVLI